MTALALELSGACVSAMPRAVPRWRRGLIDARAVFDTAVWGRLIAFELARAMATGNAEARAARYAVLRERVRRAEARHIDAMEITLQGLTATRALPGGPGLSRIEGPGYRSDGVLLYVPGGSFVVERSPQFTAVIARISRGRQRPMPWCATIASPPNTLARPPLTTSKSRSRY